MFDDYNEYEEWQAFNDDLLWSTDSHWLRAALIRLGLRALFVALLIVALASEVL